MPILKQPRAFGLELETIALQHLSSQGLQLVCRNFLCKLGEIDLIMLDGKTLVFVEVRYRRSSRFGSPVETVDRRKQRKLVRTAQLYLAMHYGAQSVACRFDILGMTPGCSALSYHFDWRRNAFDAHGA